MNKYIFYTLEGFTQSSTNEDCNNIQILGFENGNNQSEAMNNLITENKWIEKLGFDITEIQAKQLLTDENKQDIKTVIDFISNNKQRNLETNDLSHIFIALERLKKLINDRCTFQKYQMNAYMYVVQTFR